MAAALIPNPSHAPRGIGDGKKYALNYAIRTTDSFFFFSLLYFRAFPAQNARETNATIRHGIHRGFEIKNFSAVSDAVLIIRYLATSKRLNKLCTRKTIIGLKR